jgi:hypothetical protein
MGQFQQGGSGMKDEKAGSEWYYEMVNTAHYKAAAKTKLPN